MSATGREQNDSDGSWTWVDNEEENFRKRAETRRASSYERAERPEIEEIVDDPAQESDISILTDPEDHPEAGAENVQEGTPLGSNDLEHAKQHFKEMAAEMQKAAAVKAALDVAKPGESEIAVTERRVRSYLRSTLTSAGFMIGGLLIAVYCQWGCDGNYESPVQEYYDHPYEDHDVEFIQTDYKGKFNKHKASHKENLKYAAQTHKNAKEKYEDTRPGQHHQGGKRHREDHDDYNEHYDKKQKKGDFKHKDKHDKHFDNDGYDKHEHKGKKEHKKSHKDIDHSPENKENYKHNKHEKYQEHQNKKNDVKKHHKKHDSDEHEDYLYKKEAYLKQKESKLKQKEYKLYAKDASNEKFDKRDKHDKKKKQKFARQNETASGEWYDNMHKGRKDKRKQDEQADWMFDRAQGRDKKRDKAHWYFDMMDERETNRVKKT